VYRASSRLRTEARPKAASETAGAQLGAPLYTEVQQVAHYYFGRRRPDTLCKPMLRRMSVFATIYRAGA